MVIEIEHPTAGLFRSLGIPLRFRARRRTVRCPPPTLGESTDVVLKEVLGFSEAEIESLRSRQIV